MKHLDDYREIHRANPRYGPGPGGSDLETLKRLCAPWKVSRAIDYGCGNSRAAFALWPEADVCLYDPAIPGKDAQPVGHFDAGLSSDVLEHIPLDEITGVLDHMAALAPRWLLIIHTGPAGQRLPSGGNAHVLQRPMPWWCNVLLNTFRTVRGFETSRPYRVGFVAG